jgi:HSP20 family protein
MPIRRKNKISIRPKDKKAEIIERKPYNLWSEMDRMFDDFRMGFDDLFWPLRQTHTPMEYNYTRTPPMDLADLGDKYELQAEMPGIPKEDINIEVSPNTIEISAEYNEEKEDKEKNWIHRERSSIKYYRSFDTPEELKVDEAEAEFNNGILKLKLPKLKPVFEKNSKKIKIK